MCSSDLVLTGLGVYGEAEVAAREAVRRAEETDLLTWQAEALGALADVLAAAGRTDDAREAYGAAEERYARKGNVIGQTRMHTRRENVS